MGPVRKFSMIYDPAEDRLAWDGEDGAGGAVRVWLTRRFCRDFVPALVGRLPKPRAPAGQQGTVQSFAQAAAMSSFGRIPGVTLAPDSAMGLVRSAHVAPAAHGMRIEFVFGADERCAIELDAAAVRQMLTVMHRLHEAAGWPTDGWPDWIAGAGAAPSDAPMN